MSKTLKEKWFTSASRRSSLLFRYTLLELFTISSIYRDSTPFKNSDTKQEVFKIEEESLVNNVIASYENRFLNPTDPTKYDTPDVHKHYLLFTDDTYIYGLDYIDNQYRAILLGVVESSPFRIHDKLYLENNDIENYSGAGEFTLYGNYIVNYFSLASVFGNKIPYINKEIRIRTIESIIGPLALSNEITVDQITKYLNHTFFLGSFSELIVPVYSKKSLTTDPKISVRRQELFDQYKDQLHDPVIGSKIEDELIAMDKEWLKGDPAFSYINSSSKRFNVSRKRQYLTGGLMEDFSTEKGNYGFIREALSDGWSKDSFSLWCNDIRKGSYSRGIDTANGGVQTKYLLRMLQSIKLTDDDCGTKRSLLIYLNDNNVQEFYGRNLILPSGKLEVLTSRNVKQYINTTQRIRSVMYCESKPGLCFTCAGENYRFLDVKALGAMALEIGSTFLLQSMKSMHGTKLSSFELTNLDQYCV